MDKPQKKPWNPYICGAHAGVLMVLSVWIAGQYFGASTTFARNAMAIEKTATPEHVEQLDYYQKYQKKSPLPDWQMIFVSGILGGALIASVATKSFRVQFTPDMWRQRFGKTTARRAIVAFIGGVLGIFGVRMAGGCPSGHGLSGLMQLSVSGYVALICFFVGGLVMARIVYGGRDKK